MSRFNKLLESLNSKFTKNDLIKLFNYQDIENYDQRQTRFQHFVYKLNLFDTSDKNDMQIDKFLKVIKNFYLILQ